MSNGESKPDQPIDLKGMKIERLAKVLGIDVNAIQEQANKIMTQLEKMNGRIGKIEEFQTKMDQLSKSFGVDLTKGEVPQIRLPQQNPNPNTNPNPQMVQNPQVLQAQAMNNPILAMLFKAMSGGEKSTSMLDKIMLRSMARNMLISDYLLRGFLRKFGETEFKSYLKEITSVEGELGVRGMQYAE